MASWTVLTKLELVCVNGEWASTMLKLVMCVIHVWDHQEYRVQIDRQDIVSCALFPFFEAGTLDSRCYWWHMDGGCCLGLRGTWQWWTQEQVTIPYVDSDLQIDLLSRSLRRGERYGSCQRITYNPLVIKFAIKKKKTEKIYSFPFFLYMANKHGVAKAIGLQI